LTSPRGLRARPAPEAGAGLVRRAPRVARRRYTPAGRGDEDARCGGQQLVRAPVRPPRVRRGVPRRRRVSHPVPGRELSVSRRSATERPRVRRCGRHVLRGVPQTLRHLHRLEGSDRGHGWEGLLGTAPPARPPARGDARAERGAPVGPAQRVGGARGGQNCGLDRRSGQWGKGQGPAGQLAIQGCCMGRSGVPRKAARHIGLTFRNSRVANSGGRRVTGVKWR